jgi:hypothetical protein
MPNSAGSPTWIRDPEHEVWRLVYRRLGTVEAGDDMKHRVRRRPAVAETDEHAGVVGKILTHLGQVD